MNKDVLTYLLTSTSWEASTKLNEKSRALWRYRAESFKCQWNERVWEPATGIWAPSGLLRPQRRRQRMMMWPECTTQPRCRWQWRPRVLHFLACHGICVRPYGRLPSERRRPIGSLTASTLARPRARQTRSFKVWWRDILPALRLQAWPWVPSGPTLAPHGHWWGS